MAEDRTPNNRQICIGAYEIMRKLLYKRKQLLKGLMLDLHWNMLAVKYDAVLIVIYIRRILESPLHTAYFNRNDSVILSCRMIYSACIAFILDTKLAFGIAALFCKLGCCNRLRVFLRLGQVNGNVHFSILCISLPLHILPDTVSSDIICILAECIIPVCCCLGAFFLI